MPEVTFRDYAMAVMQNQLPTAVAQLQTLLGLSEDHATAATAFFKQRVGDPTFMPKAMSLRQAVTSLEASTLLSRNYVDLNSL